MNVRKLKGRMAEEGVSTAGLCRLTGISPNRLYRAFGGKRVFDTKEVEDICRVLHITNPADIVAIFLPTCPNSGTCV